MGVLDPHRHNRAAALALLHEYTQSESLRRHALAVDVCLRAYARRLGGDEELWGLAGLLHDFDYERWPQLPDHPQQGSLILAERGWPEELRRAILSHASLVERQTPLEHALFAVDELTGFLTACALVKPSRRLAEVEPASVRKKMKDKAFARTVHREDIVQGAEELGVELDEHIVFCRDAMVTIAGQLGLAGS